MSLIFDDYFVKCSSYDADSLVKTDWGKIPKEWKNNDFKTKLPLILAVIAIVVGIGEGLGTPMLMGWDNIIISMVIAVVGGLIGIFLWKK